MRHFNWRYPSIMLLCVIWIACYKDSAFNNINPDDVIKVTADTTAVLADGVHSAVITATISTDAAPDRRKVVLRTNKGAFKGGSGDSIVLDANPGFIVTAELVSTITGAAEVTAEARQVKALLPAEVMFKRAYPNAITVSVDSFVIYNQFSSETTIAAALTSQSGKPSKGQLVYFKVTYDDGTPVGAFLNNIDSVATDINGNAKIRYSAGETSRLGYLTIMAITKDEQGVPITANTRIYLTTPKP